MDVLVYLGCNIRLVQHLVVQSFGSFDGSVVVLSQFFEILLLKILDRDLVVDSVHSGVLHDGLDPLLLGELYQLSSGSWISEGFCRNCEEELVLEVLDGQRLDEDELMEVEMRGSTQVMMLEGTDP